MGHRPIQQKNGPLTTEIAILNLKIMVYWNFKFISNKWKMAHTKLCPAITLVTQYMIKSIVNQFIKCRADAAEDEKYIQATIVETSETLLEHLH